MLFSVLALSAVVSFVTASSEVPSLSLQKRTDFDGDCDDDDGYAATVTSYFARPTHSAYNASENNVQYNTCRALYQGSGYLPAYRDGICYSGTPCRSQWTSNLCDTNICQVWADLYNVKIGVTFGTMPSIVRRSFSWLKCQDIVKTEVTTEIGTCMNLYELYGLVPLKDWKNCPPGSDCLEKWSKYNCYSHMCSILSWEYDIEPNVQWGSCPGTEASFYSDINCNGVLLGTA